MRPRPLPRLLAPLARPPLRREVAGLTLLMVGFTVLASVHAALLYTSYRVKGYDLGIFDQAVRQYALFNPPIVSVKGVGFHLLGDHFHPILALLAPAYWIWDDPRMLGIVTGLALAASAVPVHLVLRGRLGPGWSLAAVAGLLFSWPYQAMVNWGLHEVTLAVPVIAWLLWALDRGRAWTAVLLCLPLLAAREDLGVTVAAVAVVLAVRRRWAPAAVALVAGVAGYWFATSVAIPHFSPDGSFFYWQFQALGPDLGSSVTAILTRPWEAAAALVDHPLKVALLLLHLVPLLFLPLLSPLTIIALPVLLSRLWNDRLTVWAPVYQYDAILAPVMLLAAVQAAVSLARRRPWAARLPQRVTAVFLGTAVVGTLFVPVLYPFHRTLTGQITVTERARDLDHAASLIPDGVCVEAPDTVIPHLTPRTLVTLAGQMDPELPTWMVVDLREREPGGWDSLPAADALGRAEDLGFERVWDERGVVVLHRPDHPVNPVCSEYLRHR
ncbi:DUF2079 domain-containing protein [Micrococcus sp.]|uniref:DUF2079 domain-containing protein n=1 Tax=Micrococcus sp. TaxID=1271 RepID=UPI002A91B7C2|nr:DUF2079 domain-containing protein [Micrococcus sp.]MDY6054393.1 DUF2079 domain-containing protein [Micrococcus sp.]